MKTMTADFLHSARLRYRMIFAGLISVAMLGSCRNGNNVQTVQQGPRPESQVKPEVHGWNLKVPDQPDFTINEVDKLVSPIYDSVPNEPMTESAEDTVTRAFAALKFFDDGFTLYAVAVYENQGPMYGVSGGWCDLFVFAKENGRWKMTDHALDAGGGGMYGNSGHLDTVVRVGRQSAGFVLSGGQTHMGALFFDDIVILNQGRLMKKIQVYTHHEYGMDEDPPSGYHICETNTYRFLDRGKEFYDLKIIKSNCDRVSRAEDSVTIPYQKGYKIPSRFAFEG